MLLAVGADAPRRLRRQVEQRADGARGALARAQLQHLAEQHQHGDHRGGLEIDRHRPVMRAEGRREQPRQQRRRHAVEIGRAGAEGDQREHVEVARDERLRPALEERPARPQDDRRRQRELHPVRRRLREEAVPADEMRPHLQHEHRRGEREPDPEPPRHVGELRVGRRFGADQLRLQRHAADRAGAGAFLPYLRVHRAGVDRAFRHRGLLRLRRREVALRIGLEFCLAAGGAEIIRAAVVLGAVLGGVRIDRHAADGIKRLAVGGVGRVAGFGAGFGLGLRAVAAAACRGGGMVGVVVRHGRPRSSLNLIPWGGI